VRIWTTKDAKDAKEGRGFFEMKRSPASAGTGKVVSHAQG